MIRRTVPRRGGRPLCFFPRRSPLAGGAPHGERGVRRALDMLAVELDRVLGQLGCRSVADLGPSLLR